MSTTTLKELLGDKLLQHNDSGDETVEISTDELNEKIVGLYFSAHWCPPCRRFTPKLAEAFNKLSATTKNKLDIVFLSADRDQDSFNEYFGEMPWKALPFTEKDRVKSLGEKFSASGIPHLVILSSTGEIISKDAVGEARASFDEALQKWSQGKSLFWTREAKEGEYVWEDVTCSKCYFSPLVGKRYTCLNDDCSFDLCETCVSQTKHEHELTECLQPNKQYPLEQLLKTVPHLLKPNSDEQIETKSLWQDDVQSVGFYFSAHWCPPCRHFTPQLAELYKAAQDKHPSFRLVFVSCDRDKESFDEYRAEMPWPAVPLDAGSVLKNYFQFNGIPTLMILSKDGTFLSRKGRTDVTRKDVDAFETWAKGDKLPQPSADQYVWAHVGCDGECKTFPIVGQRYTCETCGNFDLCSECQKKGHEHELKLVPQPEDDDD